MDVLAPAARDRRPTTPGQAQWRYLVLAGLSTSLILSADVLPSFGLLYGDFLRDLGEGSQTTALIVSAYSLSASLSGLFIKPILGRFSLRTVGCCAAVVFCVGGVLCVVVTTVPQLLVVYGVLQGSGLGIMSVVGFTTFNRYFVHRRVLMMSVAQTLIGIGATVMPLLIDELLDTFGYRGCLAILAAMNGHVLVAMLVMHPVEWHMHREKHQTCETYSSIATDMDLGEFQVVSPNAGEAPISKIVSMFVDVNLLKDCVYLNISMGLALTYFSDMMFSTFVPLYLHELDYSKTTAAQIVSIGAACDLVARIALGVCSTCVQISARMIFLAAAAATVVARLGNHLFCIASLFLSTVFLHVTDYTAMVAIIGFVGLMRALLYVPFSLILADHLPVERYPSGHGLCMFIQGVISLGLGPCVGWVRDYSGSFVALFACLTGILGVCVASWTIEVACRRLRMLNGRR